MSGHRGRCSYGLRTFQPHSGVDESGFTGLQPKPLELVTCGVDLHIRAVAVPESSTVVDGTVVEVSVMRHEPVSVVVIHMVGVNVSDVPADCQLIVVVLVGHNERGVGRPVPDIRAVLL